jgi:tellurite resistance protein
MAGLAPVELHASCAACGLESGVVEVYDPFVAACRFGLPATTRCKLCDAASEGTFDRPLKKPLSEIPANGCPACLAALPVAAIDERTCRACGARAGLAVVRAGRFSASSSFSVSVAELERALDGWAEADGWASRDELLAATFADPDVGRLFARLERREPLEVLADPFANMGIRTTGEKSEPAAAPDTPPLPDAPAVALATARTEPLAKPIAPPVAVAAPLPLPLPLPPPPSAPPRAIVFPLVSVVAADGEIHPAERALIDRFLVSEGLAPLAPEEIRVHHPTEVAHLVAPARREDVVKLMCETASIDGMPDESERRVIRAYATAWGVDDEKIDFWMWGYETMNTSLTRQLFLKIRRFVLSARWSERDLEHESSSG